MRRTTGLALAMLVFALAILLLAEPPGQPVKDPLGRPSTFFTDGTGARAAFLVIQKVLGRDAARRHQSPLDALPEDCPDTLIVAGPSRPLQTAEDMALEDWLTAGGQLILASEDGWAVAEEQDTLLESYGVSLKSSAPPRPHRVTVQPQGWALWLHRDGRWEGDFEVLARGDSQVVAVEVPVGEGRIVALADPWVISNESLRAGDNGLWLVRLVEGWGDGRALFDEYHLGFGKPASLFAVMGSFLASPWGWPVAQLAVAGLLYVVVCRRRLGRVIRRTPLRLTDPLLLLQARAGLFRGASAGKLAGEQILSHLAHLLRDATGRPADLREVQLRLANEGREQAASRLQTLLDTWEAASRTGRVRPEALLAMARMASQIREELSSGSQYEPRT